MRFEKLLFVLLARAALDAGAVEVRQFPYDEIANRNVFQLHAPPTIAEIAPKPPQLRKTTLTGILTILGRPMAFITIDAINPGEPAVSVMLAEGQTLNGIVVTSIDKQAAVVTILNERESQILNFELAKSSGVQPFQPAPIPRASPPAVTVRPDSTMTPEEQAALIEIQRVKFQQEGNPIHSLLPPTGVTAE